MAAHRARPARRGGGRRPAGPGVVDRRRPPRTRHHPGVARDPHRRHGNSSVATGRPCHAARPAPAPSSHAHLSRDRTRSGRAAHARPRRRQGSGWLTNTGQTNRGERGTQPERTALAWTRTSLAVLANGVILSLRETNNALQFAAAAAAAVLALSTYLIGGAVVALILISALALTV